MRASSAAFDLACAGALAAATTRRPARLAAAAPYAVLAARDTQRSGKRFAAAKVAADAVGAAALAYGSARARSLLL